jgi:hypothetical protein
MKLNKTELVALSARIISELKEAAESKQKELDIIQDEQNKPAAVLAIKAVKTMNNALREYIARKHTDLTKLTVSDITRSMRKNQTEVNVPYRYDNEIFNALVIAQMDSPDVVSLIEKVKASFIKI